jgi:HD-like signal output (HDOD) protein
MFGTQSVRILEMDPVAGFAGAERNTLAPFSESLPASPVSLSELRLELDRTAIDLSRITNIVRRDMSLTFQVLALANTGRPSASTYGVANAIVLAGVDGLRSIASRVEATAFEPNSHANALWLHAQLSATLSHRVACFTGETDPEQAYVAGLIHDIGKLPMAALQSGPNQSDDTRIADHVQVGSWLARVWDLPFAFSGVIANHHRPVQFLRERPLLAAVSVANRFCHAFGMQAEPHPCQPVNAARLDSIFSNLLPRVPGARRPELAEALEDEYLSWSRSPLFFAALHKRFGNEGDIQ